MIGDLTKKNFSVPRYEDKFSVTQYISALFPGHYDSIPKHYLIRASQRGKKVHELIHLHDMKENIDASVYKEFYNYLDAYLEFRSSYKYQLKHSELALIDSELKVAGTLDKMFEFKNAYGIPTLDLVDLKTRKVFYLMDVFQVNIYALLYKNKMRSPVSQRHILSLTKQPNGKIKFKYTDVYNKYVEEIFKVISTYNVIDRNFVMPKQLKILTDNYVKSVKDL